MDTELLETSVTRPGNDTTRLYQAMFRYPDSSLIGEDLDRGTVDKDSHSVFARSLVERDLPCAGAKFFVDRIKGYLDTTDREHRLSVLFRRYLDVLGIVGGDLL
jgi:hypothetical protein